MPGVKLFRRAEIWVPTWQGWIVIFSLPCLGLAGVLSFAYPFLNVHEPIGSDYLVVEGWMSRQQLSTSASLFRDGTYRELIVTGGASPKGSYLNVHYPDLETVAEIGAVQIRSFGISPVHAVPRPDAVKDRTYTSALALRKWLIDTARTNVRLDIVSSGPHSRRSWMLFKIALEGVAEIGVIATEPTGYDPSRWWTSSAGVRAMIGELIAYAYAKFLFYPNPEKDLKTVYGEAS